MHLSAKNSSYFKEQSCYAATGQPSWRQLQHAIELMVTCSTDNCLKYLAGDSIVAGHVYHTKLQLCEVRKSF